MGNYTESRITNSALRYMWAVNTFVLVLCAQFGCALILYASIKYKAIRMHPFTVIIIHHIACCDILTSLVLVVFAVGVTADDNLLGDGLLCAVCAYLPMYSIPASLVFMAALSASKYLILRYPLREMRWSKCNAHRTCWAIWASSGLFPMFLLAVDKSDVEFTYRDYTCQYQFKHTSWRILQPIVGILFTVLPITVVVTTTGCLIREARKIASRSRDRLKIQGLITIILTAVAFVISVFPIALYYVVKLLVTNPPEAFQVHYYRIAMVALSVNIMFNAVIYFFTLHGFRKFVKDRVSLRRIASRTASVRSRGRSPPIFL